MAPTLTPETDVESLVGDVDAESLRTSERHRADLERWAKGIAGQDLTLDFTTENGETARVDYSQSPPHVTIPGWEIPQPVTDLDRPAYDILMQQALTLHEVGHVLYTDEDVASEATADVSPKHREQFQRFWNALEDGAIEEQLRRDYDVTEELGVMNANFLGRPEGEFGIMDAVLASCLDLGVYDTGTLRRLADPDDEAVRFSSEDDRELFADEIFDELVETVGAVRTEPDPISRVEAAYEGWQAIEEHIDAADDTSGDRVSFNDGHPCPADGAAGATAEMAQTAQQGMEDRIEEFLDSVDGIDAETDSIADDGASADGEAATGSEPEASQKPTDDTQGSETDRETADADTGEDASSRESSDDAGSGARQTAESSAGDGTDPESTEAADDADAGGETAEGVTSTADLTGHDQDDVGEDAPAENERDQHTDEPPTDTEQTSETSQTDAEQTSETSQTDAEQTSETSQTDAEQTDDEQQEGAVDSSEASSDSEGSHDGVTESSDADTPESEADVGSSEEADETADGTGADGPSEKEATGEATDTPETRDADERTDARDSTARATQDDSTGERLPDSGESSSAPGDGQSPGETEAEAPQKGAGGGELELPDGTDDSAGSAGTEPDQRNTDSEVEDDVWTDDLDTDPEVPPEVADEYQSRAEEQLEQQERAADRRAEELESLQETLDEIDDVYVDDLRIVEGAVDGTYRSSEVSDIRQESRRLSNILQRQLQQEQRSEYRHDQRQGDLDTRVTHRLQLYDFRVFRQEISPDEKDYDVVFVLDRSGSMGSDIYAAERATATLAMALETVEVDTCIIDMYDYEPRVAKPFGTDIEDSLRAILTGDYTGGTPLSPCLELARNHLRKRSSHPFMIVVTDGRPRNEERYSELLKRTKFPVLGVYLDFLASGPNDVPQHVRDAGHLFNRRRIITAEEELLPGLRQLCQNVMF